jgi:CBS domain-containing protein
MATVSEVMVKKVITVTKDTEMPKLCRLITRKKLSGVPVVNGKGRLVGFISERDIIAAVPKPRFMERTAGQIMTRKVKSIGPEEPLTNASKIFSAAKYRQLPVVKAGKVVGIIARKDVIQHMLGRYY